MRNKSHNSLISIVRSHVSEWRKEKGWSRETVVAEIVAAHERIGGEAASGIRFEPNTLDTFERMKVNADRVFRWLDDESKDTNLLPSNFLPSILEAMPHMIRRHCLDEILRPLGLGVRTLEAVGSQAVCVGQMTNLLREQAEAAAATAELLDGNATSDELERAHRELSESIVTTRNVRASIESQLAGMGIVKDPSQ